MKQSIFPSVRIALVVIIAFCALEGMSAKAAVIADDFSEEMQFLEEQDEREVGREAKISAYEQLIRDYAQDPRRAKAMLKIAAIWEHTIPEINVKPNPEEAMIWLRRARDAAVKGSKDWREAQFMIAGRVRWTDIEEARQILDEIYRLAPNPVVETRVLLRRQGLFMLQRRFDEAEKICIQLQEWPNDPSRMPDAMLEKGDIYANMQASAYALTSAWVTMDVPKSVRQKKLEEFVREFPTAYNQRLFETRTAELSKMRDGPNATTANERPGGRDKLTVSRSAVWRFVVIVGSNILLVVIVAAIYFRSRRKAAKR